MGFVGVRILFDRYFRLRIHQLPRTDPQLRVAHKIRNRASQLFRATCEIPASFRWCLTGTPIQNSLDDFGSLLAFLRVPPFTKSQEFRFWISSPVESKRLGSLHVLRKLVRATCLRRTKAAPDMSQTLKLPRKVERVEFVNLSADEMAIYNFFKRRSYSLATEASKAKTAASASRKRRRVSAANKSAVAPTPSRKGSSNIIVLISVLRMVCDHGEALLPQAALDAWRNRNIDAINWSLLESLSQQDRACYFCGCRVDGSQAELGQGEVLELSCEKHAVCNGCKSRVGNEPSECGLCCSSRGTASALHTLRSSNSAYSASTKVSALISNVLDTLTDRSKSSLVGDNKPVKMYVIATALSSRFPLLFISFLRLPC